MKRTTSFHVYADGTSGPRSAHPGLRNPSDQWQEAEPESALVPPSADTNCHE